MYMYIAESPSGMPMGLAHPRGAWTGRAAKLKSVFAYGCTTKFRIFRSCTMCRRPGSDQIATLLDLIGFDGYIP